MTDKRFCELLEKHQPIFLLDEITEIVYDFTNYPNIRVKSKSGKIVSRQYDKTYDDDVKALLYGTEITEEEFNKFS